VRAARRVRVAKGAHKCGGVGSARDELHRALKEYQTLRSMQASAGY
jgi:hypothetical protein